MRSRIARGSWFSWLQRGSTGLSSDSCRKIGDIPLQQPSGACPQYKLCRRPRFGRLSRVVVWCFKHLCAWLAAYGIHRSVHFPDLASREGSPFFFLNSPPAGCRQRRQLRHAQQASTGCHACILHLEHLLVCTSSRKAPVPPTLIPASPP